MAVIILGAGATRGCSFVNNAEDPSCPPLDGDFFTQLQRARGSKHRVLIDDVVKDTVEMFGGNFDVTMETVFTTLEHTIRMLKATRESRDFKLSDLRKKRGRLKQAMAAAFEESLTERNDRGESTRHLRKCGYHDKLVAGHLRCGDEIISFNYDCVIDDSLRREGHSIWNPRYGYGFNLGPRGARMTGDTHWMPKEPGTKDRTVKLYKLHGSFHFQISGMDSQDESGDQAKSKEKKPYTVILKRRPYTKQKGSLRFSIIPPEWHKAYDEGAFADLWAQAAKAIHRADSIVFIGYSLPATDLHSTALFRTSVGKARLKHLTVVNPDQEARRRVRTVLQRGCTKGTRMLSFDSLEHFAAADRSLWGRS